MECIFPPKFKIAFCFDLACSSVQGEHLCCRYILGLFGFDVAILFPEIDVLE